MKLSSQRACIRCIAATSIVVIASRSLTEEMGTIGLRLRPTLVSMHNSALSEVASFTHDIGYDNTFSACVLTMDDNAIWTEWLAYHYHVLPLRHLIVAVDPRSATSPSHIFDRWRKLGMTIVEWRDEDFLSKALQEQVKNTAESNARKLKDNHRARQTSMHGKCLQVLKEANRTWTLLTDTDEFIHYQKDAFQQANLSFPDIALTSGKIYDFLEHHPPEKDCVTVPRVHFGSRESTIQEQHKDVPLPFNATLFGTLRWRYHGGYNIRNAKEVHGLSKTMINVQNANVTGERGKSVHRPLPICDPPFVRAGAPHLLYINHYSGSWERSMSRNDARKWKNLVEHREQKQALLAAESEDTIRPWFKGFVASVGKDKARELLKGAGDLELPRLSL